MTKNKITDLLRRHFVQRKNKNSSYSLRAFARHLGMSPSALSEILNGKRKITKKTAEIITSNLCLDPYERTAIIGSISEEFAKHDPEYVQLETDQFKVVADWYYFAILSLFELESFDSSPVAIARRLNIPVQDAKQALLRLERLEMLKRDKKNRLLPTGKQFKTSDGIVNTAIKRNHQQGLQLAMDAVQSEELGGLDFMALTMAVDPKKISKAKNMIRKFGYKLASTLEAEQKTDVYRLQIQLFSLSNKVM